MRYKVGDKVRVRQWDDMAKEFGFTNSNEYYIDIPDCTFLDRMKKFCGSVVTISNIVCGDSRYLIEEDDEDWYWVDEMFESYKVRIPHQADFIDKEAFAKMVEMEERLEKCKLSTEDRKSVV